jgi:hypothetical protein
VIPIEQTEALNPIKMNRNTLFTPRGAATVPVTGIMAENIERLRNSLS